MASFRDPARTFAPVEVIERLLEITEFYGDSASGPVLYISSDDDIATYLDSFGFDIYSLTADTHKAFKTTSRSSLILPSGSRSHDSATTH